MWDEGQEVFLKRVAQSFCCGHHVLKYRVVLWHVRHLSCLDHCLHDDLSICTKCCASHCASKEGNALECLAQQGTLLSLVHSTFNHLLQHRHQVRIVLCEAALDLPGNCRHACDCLTLQDRHWVLQLFTELLHESLCGHLEVFPLQLGPIVLEEPHACQHCARTGIAEACQHLSQQLRRLTLLRDGLRLVLHQLGQSTPGHVTHSGILRAELCPCDSNHLLGDRLLIDVLCNASENGKACNKPFPVAGVLENLLQARLQVCKHLVETPRLLCAATEAIHGRPPKSMMIFIFCTLLCLCSPSVHIVVQLQQEAEADIEHRL
mmetsp:Transcript_114965/g.199303  ORF Transcript_114965/g.199303 Transcript_114965/m.199303 type:complete len:320 (+) Transcript_114965:1517-2476(+)